jgi:hypothetical protein
MRTVRDHAGRVVRVTLAALALLLGAAGSASAFPLLEPPYQVDGPIGARLAALDYDADGLVDIAGFDNDGMMTLRRGTLTGFANPQTLAVPAVGYTPAIVVGDLDGDDIDDLVVAYGQSAEVVLIRGRADGELEAPAAGDVHSMGTATAYPHVPVAIDVADLDGDDDLDVVAAKGVDEDTFLPANTLENGHATVFVNDGDGGLTASAATLAINAPGDLELVELAGDADPDLVVAQRNRPAASTVKIFPGAAGASFGAPTYAFAGAPATELDAGHFDADGRVDVVVAHGAVGTTAPSPASLLAGAVAPASLGPPSTIAGADGSDIVVGDVDRDGRDDLYVARGDPGPLDPEAHDNPIFVRGLGVLQFAPADRGQLYDLPRSEASPQLTDVDGDGKVDIVTSGWSGNLPPTHVFIRFGLGPQLVPQGSDLDFGFAVLGTRTGSRAITFENVGPGTAAQVAREDAGDIGDFPLTSDTCSGATLAVGQTCTLAFAFAPTALEDRIAEVSTFAPDSDFVFGAGLIGTGLRVIPTPPAPPPPPPPPPPAAAPISLRPTITRTTRRGLLLRGLRFTQRFPAAGSVRWTLKLRVSRSRPAVVVARSTRTLRRGGSIRKTILLSRSGRRAVRRSRATTLVLQTSYTPTGGARRENSATTRLRR